LVNGTLKALYFLGVLAEIVIRLPHERRRRRTRRAVDRVTTSEQTLVGLVSVGLFFVSAAYALTPWLDGVNYRLSPEARERAGVVGTALIVAAVWLFWRSHADLGATGRPRSSYGRGTRSSPEACTGRSAILCMLPCGSGA